MLLFLIFFFHFNVYCFKTILNVLDILFVAKTDFKHLYYNAHTFLNKCLQNIAYANFSITTFTEPLYMTF